MDLTSLPDEMLANVLKYTRFELGRRLRKRNKRIDQVAKRARIHTTSTVRYFIINETEIVIKQSRTSLSFTLSNDNPPKAIEKWLSRAKISDRFCIRGPFNFDEVIFNILRRYRKHFLKVKDISFTAVTFSLSNHSFAQFIQEFCPNATKLQLTNNSGTSEHLLNKEVLGDRIWTSFTIIYPFEAPYLNDKFLVEVVAKTTICALRETTTRTSFTASGVFSLVQALSIVSREKLIIHLYKVQLGDLNFSDVERFCETKLPGVNILYLDDFDEIGTHTRFFKIVFGEAFYRPRERYLTFEVAIE